MVLFIHFKFIFLAMVFVAHRRWWSAQASFLWRKEAKNHQRGQAPFDISLAPNAGYLRHLAFVLLLVWRIIPLGLRIQRAFAKRRLSPPLLLRSIKLSCSSAFLAIRFIALSMKHHPDQAIDCRQQ